MPVLSRIAHAIVLSWGWRRALIAIAAGAFAVLGLEPFGIWPVMFVSFSNLLWQIDGIAAYGWRGAMTGVLLGWCFGFGYFVAGFYWVGYAFLVDVQTFG